MPSSPWAAEFRSIIGDTPVVMYDAPSAKARKMFIAGRHLPVEVVVVLEQWAKVRDSSSELAWVEKKHLSDKRFVIVTAPRADVRQLPDGASPLVFQAERNVVLEFEESAAPGWIRVRHRDGQSGFVRTNQVWGS